MMLGKKIVLKYELQFFAKDGPGGEKTEPATAKKLQDARKEGQVAKSKELVTGLSLIGMFVTLKVAIGYIGTSLMELFGNVYKLIGTLTNPEVNEITIPTVMGLMRELIISMLLIMAPFLAVCTVIAIVGDLFQVKWKPTTKPLKPKPEKLSPLKGFKRIFSSQSIANLLKSVATIIILLYAAWMTIKDNLHIFMELYDYTLMNAVIEGGKLVIDLGLKISLVYLFIGFADYIYQKRKFSKDMKMSKQEVKEEVKNSEGDPIIKSQIRRKMLQVSQRRMMQSLPEADVVITNPTHFAVALKYDSAVAQAPMVLAKGENFLAQKIKEAAREYSIEIVENKPLARMLYYNVDIGSEIPQELYQSVAEVLAFVYGLKGKK